MQRFRDFVISGQLAITGEQLFLVGCRNPDLQLRGGEVERLARTDRERLIVATERAAKQVFDLLVSPQLREGLRLVAGNGREPLRNAERVD